MSTPTVTEIRPSTEAVNHDNFVDDLARDTRTPLAAATTAHTRHRPT